MTKKHFCKLAVLFQCVVAALHRLGCFKTVWSAKVHKDMRPMRPILSMVGSLIHLTFYNMSINASSFCVYQVFVLLRVWIT